MGSGKIVRLSATRRLGMGSSSIQGGPAREPALLGDDVRLEPLVRLLGAFRSVLRPTLASVGHTGRIQRSANRVISNAGEVFDSTAADQHDRVFLQVVPFAADVRRHFVTV